MRCEFAGFAAGKTAGGAVGKMTLRMPVHRLRKLRRVVHRKPSDTRLNFRGLARLAAAVRPFAAGKRRHAARSVSEEARGSPAIAGRVARPA